MGKPRIKGTSRQRTIIVLGMHRSGTSCLAGILERAGVFFGDVSRSNTYNIKGNRENRRILELHDDLLAHNQGAWDDPPVRVEWPDALKEKRDEIIRDYRCSSLWGFKDPRVLLTLEGWLPALPDVSFAATYRHPFFVARSLGQRNGFPLDKSLNLWKIYNEKLLSVHEKFCFPLVSFDLSETVYKDKIEQLLKRLELDMDRRASEFYDNKLRSSVMEYPGEISRDIMEIYGKLNRIARSEEFP